MKTLKDSYSKYNKHLKKEKENEKNKIAEFLILEYCLKIWRLIIINMSFTYLIAMLWMVFLVGMLDFYYGVDYHSMEEIDNKKIIEQYGNRFLL